MQQLDKISKKRKNKRQQRKKNYKHAYDFKVSCMVNQLCQWIKRQRKILNINNMRCELANQQFTNEENNLDKEILNQDKVIEAKKYKDLVKIFKFQQQTRFSNQQLILQLDNCYFKKYWKQREYLNQLFYQDQKLFFTDFKDVYHWYENFHHNIEIFEALEQIFIKLFEIGQQNLKPLLMKYTTDFLIHILEQFREFYYYFIEPNMNNSDCLLFINCLLYNFLIGYVNHEIMSNTFSLIYTKRIFSQKFQLESVQGIQRCHYISSQTWGLFDYILYVSNWKEQVLEVLDFLFDSQLYRSALKMIDQSFYKDIKFNFEQNIFCVLIQQLNIKGFIHRSGKIFINVYPVLKSFNISHSQLLQILTAYCIIVSIIAVNQHQILTQYQEYLIDIIQSKITDINQPHLTLYKQLFGVKLENNIQSNLDRINYSLAMLITKEIKNISNIDQLQEKIIQISFNNQDSSYMLI